MEDRWRRISPDLLELLPTYLESLRKDSARLVDELNHQNFLKIGYIAHNFRGNGTNFGLPEITQLGHQLELQAKACDLAGSTGTISQIQEFLQGLVPPPAE